MNTNGFALFRGPGAWERAKGAALRVKRQSRSILLGSGPSFGPTSGSSVEGDTCFLTYSLEEKGQLPLVHGFAEKPAELWDGGVEGEFAFVTMRGERVLAGRDPLGTRALYTDDGLTCIASDHRFLSRSPTMLPRGVRIDLDSGERRIEKTRAQPSVRGMDEAAGLLCRLLEESVARRVNGRKKVAVSFSGGLDSSLIALLAARHTEVVLCTAYTEKSMDKELASAAAKMLGLEHRERIVGREDAANDVKRMDLPFEPGPMDKALWCLYSTTSRMATESGAGLILLGQLADELFGGYMKYALKARESEESAARMMERDVAAAADRAFVRDELACSQFAEVRFPFADATLASFALGLPLSYKIRQGERKAILRSAASMLGLPEVLVLAPKKAAQYSSGLSKVVG